MLIAMTKIRYIKDSNDQNFFPVTHERAVRDSSGKRLDEKLEEIEQHASDPNAVKYMVHLPLLLETGISRPIKHIG